MALSWPVVAGLTAVTETTASWTPVAGRPPWPATVTKVVARQPLVGGRSLSQTVSK